MDPPYNIGFDAGQVGQSVGDGERIFGMVRGMDIECVALSPGRCLSCGEH